MSKVLVIAEAGVNHNGSLDLALQLVDAAAIAGADVVKFQTFTAAKLISRLASKADYQKKSTDGNESQLAMVAKLELRREHHAPLQQRCRERGIEFLSTPFDADSLTFLVKEMDMRLIKIPSGEITNAPFLLQAARIGKPIILSTGMSTLAEVEEALQVLAFGYCAPQDPPSRKAFLQAYASPEGQKLLAERVTILHCTSEYPAPIGEVNLRAMDTMAQAFQLPVGLSDHTQGINIAIAAAARGAVVIEKHFTLDRALPGPDHQASLQPDELKRMVVGIREVEQALGNGRKVPSPSEYKNQQVVRKVLVASRLICSNETFTEDNVTLKRAGAGLAPSQFWDILGQRATREFAEDEPIVR